MRTTFLILALCAAPARADISDSGNLIIGGQGIIQGTMTVAGGAFSVGGASFSVAGGSITLGGRLNAAAAGIRWADGTTSTTAAPGGGGTLASTYTYLSGQAFVVPSAFSTAAPGSTVTFTTSGNDVLVTASLSWYQNCINGRTWYFGALRDGQFIGGETRTKCVVSRYDQAIVNGVFQVSFIIIDHTPSARTHSYSLVVYENGASGCTISFDASALSPFGAAEVQ